MQCTWVCASCAHGSGEGGGEASASAPVGPGAGAGAGAGTRRLADLLLARRAELVLPGLEPQARVHPAATAGDALRRARADFGLALPREQRVVARVRCGARHRAEHGLVTLLLLQTGGPGMGRAWAGMGWHGPAWAWRLWRDRGPPAARRDCTRIRVLHVHNTCACTRLQQVAAPCTTTHAVPAAVHVGRSARTCSTSRLSLRHCMAAPCMFCAEAAAHRLA